MAGRTTNKQKQDYARTLYLQGGLSQKEIAERVGVTEATLSRWQRKEGWKDMRAARSVTRAEQLRRLYAQMASMMDAIEGRPADKPISPSEADSVAKLTKAIKALETETGLSETVEVFMRFGSWMRNRDPDLARKFARLQDQYIKTIMQ